MLHRTHWIANNTGQVLLNSKGENVGSRFTFLKTIKSYVDQFNASTTYIAWDKKTLHEPNFRVSLTPDYKGGRNEARNREVYADVDSVTQLVETLGVKNIFPGCLEADDIISWLCKTIEGRKIIVSVDRDFVQLISADISYYNPIKKQLVDLVNFNEVFDSTPQEYLYFKAIVGDKSDNIPGIDGYGDVKGMKLAKALASFKRGETISEKDSKVLADNGALILNNLKLMDLSVGLKLHPEEVDRYSQQVVKLNESKPNFAQFKGLCTELEFDSILNSINNWQASFNKQANNTVLAEYFKTFE